MASKLEKELIEQLATVKDSNFIKGVYGLLKNKAEKAMMLGLCKETGRLTKSQIEDFYLQIVSMR